MRNPDGAHEELNALKQRAAQLTSDTDPGWDQVDVQLGDFEEFFQRLSRPINRQDKGENGPAIYSPYADDARRALSSVKMARAGVAARSVVRTIEAIGRASLEIRAGGVFPRD